MLPALSHHFHIHPWDLGRLSPEEIARYLEALDQLNGG